MSYYDRHHTKVNNNILPRSRKKIKHEGQTDNVTSIILPGVYDREYTYNYLEFNSSTERLFDRPSYLVGRAISETYHLHEKMNEEDIMLHLIIGRFVTTLSKKQKLEFACILELITYCNVMLSIVLQSSSIVLR